MKIGVTGAAGKVGRSVVRELLRHGHQVRTITLEPWEGSPVEQRQADVTNFSQVEAAVAGCEAIVHLAAIPSPRQDPDPEVFQTNVMGVYHVLLAAGRAGIRRAAVASSDCAFGVTYSYQPTVPQYLPVDENHPARPDNSYGLSKLAGEQVAAGMAKRFGMSIASLRITYVIDPHEYAQAGFDRQTKDPEAGPWNLWSYLDSRDCARAFRLAVERDFGGHEVFCIAAANHRCVIPSRELIARYFPEAELLRPFNGHESLLDGSKAKALLGFVPEYRWEGPLAD